MSIGVDTLVEIESSYQRAEISLEQAVHSCVQLLALGKITMEELEILEFPEIVAQVKNVSLRQPTDM